LSKLIEPRADFQHHAETRLTEAKALLDAGHWDGAYYLAGYAVELALKACIIKLLMARDSFPSKEFSQSCYTHTLQPLAKVAAVEVQLAADSTANAALKSFWSVTRDWSEQKRYHQIGESEARLLVEAISDPTNGVLQWIKARW
jgi:HEPN domain-containing protein